MSAPRPAVSVLDAAGTLALPLDGLKLIEASAGTGKTYTISNLYLRYVLAGRAVGQILVVTFTNAATEELRGRIRERLFRTLQALEQQDAPDAEKDAFLASLWQQLMGGEFAERDVALARLRLAVRSMDEAAIFTINGFCQRALTDHAFNSGQSFQMELMRDDGPLWEAALKDWWRRHSYPLTPAPLALLKSVFPALADFMKVQKPLRTAQHKRLLPETFATPAQVYAQLEALQVALANVGAQWQHCHEEIKATLRESPQLSRNKDHGYRLLELEQSLATFDRFFQRPSPTACPPNFHLLCTSFLQNPAHHQKSKAADPRLAHPFFALCQSVQDLHGRLQRQCRVALLREATTQAQAQVEEHKRLTRTLSYQDQLVRVHEALHGEGGDAFAAVLRRQFPVAMIDEFQDTDALQYGIFRRLYLSDVEQASSREDGQGASALILIGDPKQAIYSFRGGDIFAYAKARADARAHYTLDTNWRSNPALIQAVNTLFARHPAPFVYEHIMSFHPVTPAPTASLTLSEHGQPVPALTLWQFGVGDDNKPRGKEALRSLISETVAQEITRLLNAGTRGEASLDEAPLRAGDIAVLVRDHVEGSAVRQALAARGVNAVTLGHESVYKSEEAAALLLLLRAVVQWHDREALRRGLCSSLLGLDYSQIARTVENPQAWGQWKNLCQSLHDVWRQRGFMAMFYTLLQQTSVAEHLAESVGAERRLTNVLHVAELLQQRAAALPGFEALLSWFAQQLSQHNEEEAELRLESDDALVKIVTIHTSKGLEYPVTFVPFLWACKPMLVTEKKTDPLPFHDSQGRAFLALDAQGEQDGWAAAERERLAEDVRLAYVALTRAKAKTYLVWGAASAHTTYPVRTALAWLLHGTEGALPDVLRDEDVHAALQAYVAAAGEAVSQQELPIPESPNRLEQRAASKQDLAPRRFAGRFSRDWRISSFSALARDVHQPALRTQGEDEGDPILQFTAGSEVGLFLHAVLEELDFQGDVAQQVERLNQRHAQDYGFTATAQDALMRMWIDKIVHTPLDGTGLMLARISPAKRLNELAFDYAVSHVRLDALNTCLAQRSPGPVMPLRAEDFRGMITGVIDLVFEWNGRYYIADYKSNLLGRSLQDYTPEALQRAMLDRRYDVQSLLYVLALHRYLKQRLPGYDYERHMGGAYYLFLRGMRPESGADRGVHFERPEAAFVQALDEGLFGFTPPVGEAHP